MKRVILAIALFAMSCNADPSIVPDPIDGSVETSSSSGSSSASSASSSASSSSSSGSSSSGGPQGDGSGTRLKRYVYTSADGLSSERGNPFYDAVLNADCTPVKTVAGLRCIPAPASVAWFVDAQCTKPAAYVPKQCPVPKYGCKYGAYICTDAGASACYNISPMPLANVYSTDGNGNCIDVTAGVVATYSVYAVGPEVDYTQFAAMTLEHE